MKLILICIVLSLGFCGGGSGGGGGTPGNEPSIDKTRLTGITITGSDITLLWADVTGIDHVEIKIVNTYAINGEETVSVPAGTGTFSFNSVNGSTILADTRVSITIRSVDADGLFSKPNILMVRTISSGTVNYTPVSTAAELYNIRNDLSGNYLLTADISLAGYSSWTPIADYASDSSLKFTGILNGNGHDISGLKIVSTGDYNGLFGYTGADSIISGVSLSDVNVSGRNYTGGLLGYNGGGVVYSCYSSGTVRGNNSCGGLVGAHEFGGVTNSHSSGKVYGAYAVGGLIGATLDDRSPVKNSYSDADVEGTTNVGGLIGENVCFVSGCFATGTVKSTGDYAGGLIGYNRMMSCTQCYSSGSVTAERGAGGLVGYNNNGTLTDCYATGGVKGTRYVGGLIGYNNTGTATSCFAIGPVSGPDHAGGLVGLDNTGLGSTTLVNVNCFYNSETTGMNDTGKGTPVTTAEMVQESLYINAGWDFKGETVNGTNDIWSMGGTYPYLSDI